MKIDKEKQLYDLSKFLWAMSKALIHAPTRQIKQYLWDILNDEQKETLRKFSGA